MMFNSDSITASVNTLMRQAPMTVLDYVRAIREGMGDEWADENPQALTTLVQAAALDFHTGIIGRELGRLVEAVDNLASQMGEMQSDS